MTLPKWVSEIKRKGSMIMSSVRLIIMIAKASLEINFEVKTEKNVNNVIITPCSVSLTIRQILIEQNTSPNTGNLRDSRFSIDVCW